MGVGQQGAHLGDGDFVELEEAFGGRKPLADEHRVQTFQIGQDNELLQRSVVADVAFGIRLGIAPLLRGLSKEGDISKSASQA